MEDPVNRPSHYNQGKIECIEYILDQKFDYLEGNVVKYLTRWKRKNGLEDLRKARWYLEKLIERTQHAEDQKMENPPTPKGPLEKFIEERSTAKGAKKGRSCDSLARA